MEQGETTETSYTGHNVGAVCRPRDSTTMQLRRSRLLAIVFLFVATTLPAQLVIQKVRPGSANPPCAPFELIVEGQQLPFDGQVELGGVPLATNPGNGAALFATVSAAALAQPGPSSIVVVPSSGSAPPSPPFPFRINTTPISAISPATASIGSGPVLLTVSGNCFDSAASILWNGAPLPTTVLSPNSAQATVPAANFTSPGVARVSIRGGNGNTSVAFPFRVGPPPGGAPPPVISSISPSQTTAGASAVTVRISGTGFNGQAAVLLDDRPAPPGAALWISATEMRVTLPPSQLATAGKIVVQVENPDGARSNSTTFKTLPAITALIPATWPVGRPCDLIAVGRGFSAASFVLFEGAAGVSRLTPTSTPSPTEINVCVPPEQVSTPGPTRVRVCTAAGGEDICSVPFILDITASIRITRIRPVSAVAGSGSLCLAVDVETTSAPGALIARWDGADLPPAVSACPAPAGLEGETAQGGAGVFTATILAEVGAPLLSRERPRNPAVACPADPLAPKITAFAPGSQIVSAPACFDIAALTPTLNPPMTSLRGDGCLSVVLTGQNLHSSATVSVEGFDGQFCDGGAPTISGCGLNAADSSICTQIEFAVPSGTGNLTVTIRNPANVCSFCSDQTFNVSLDDLETQLPPDAISISCPRDGTSFPRTPVGSQSRLSCQLSNGSELAGQVGALSLAAPFAVESSDCGDAILAPGEACGVDLTFAPSRPGLFAADLTAGSEEGDGEILGRYLGVGILRSAQLTVADGPSLPAAGQSRVRLQIDGAAGAQVTAIVRQSLRLDPQVAAFPAGAGAPGIDCGFSDAVVGVPYWQPLAAACDAPGSRWEASSVDGAGWASVQGEFLGGVPTQTGAFNYEIRLETGFPDGNPSVSRTCTIRVVDTPSASSGVSTDQPLIPCTSAQFGAGGLRVAATVTADQPLEADFQTGTVAGTLRYMASFEADGIDVSPYVEGPEAGTTTEASIGIEPPVITSGTFSCASGSQLTVEVSGYSVTREIGSMRFAFQAAPGATGTLQLGGDAASRPDLVTTFAQRYSAVDQDLDGGFILRAIFNVSGRAADIGGVDFSLQNSAGSASVNAAPGGPACSSQQ